MYGTITPISGGEIVVEAYLAAEPIDVDGSVRTAFITMTIDTTNYGSNLDGNGELRYKRVDTVVSMTPTQAVNLAENLLGAAYELKGKE